MSEGRDGSVDAAIARRDGTLALVLAAVLLAALITLLIFFAIGGPFGAINDWLIFLAGLLVGLLAVVLEGREDIPAPAGGIVVGLAVLGAVFVVAGSGLVISRTTGFLLGGLAETVGWALVGVWLLVLGAAARRTKRWPAGLSGLAIATGVVLALGFVVAPGVVSRLDDADTAPWWVWVGFVSWLGVFVLFPIWCAWYGQLRRGVAPPPAT